ncbi:hypothetical protein AYM40_21370 [Paraburkholderia phytofirmans OLGA172]|uniref:Uncharacterized protein n=1 Tax=Paraburkholderia phytofirmans OLGA172 TaxID=1417228 RepID=A0A161HZ78_9BURK|nr:hypothetical protein [Paraburkholderia phytofirmans]ANB74987.1 hypothetical protein AYM40_21370 [Paraburkholderia phytofirmans OLGA172]
MLAHILAEVNQISDDFQQTTQVQISKNTRGLIAETISSIIQDPHPAWQLPAGRNEQYARAYLQALPLFFYGMLKEDPMNGPISAFQFLHWLSNNLNFSLCIIKKP